MNEKTKIFGELLDIMDTLRNNCPWDKKQTIESLRYLTIEEIYELSDAILENDYNEIRNELGDILLHIVFYSKIAEEKGEFSIKDVIEGINKKLIHRHPHIYGKTEVNDDEDVKRNWEKIKLKEGRKSVLEGVPKALPAVVKAFRIQEKVKGVGFDWEKPNQVWDKVMEEISELKKEVDSNSPKEAIENEFGDVLFALVNYARFLDINPEDALEKTNKKFIERFKYLENKANMIGKSLHDMTLAEMDIFWDEAKSKE